MEYPKNMGFRKISIQEELIVAIEKVMNETGAYRSIAEFVSEAVRLRLEQLAKIRQGMAVYDEDLRREGDIAQEGSHGADSLKAWGVRGLQRQW